MPTAAESGVRVLVTGAGGFIGHHLVAFLKQRGYWVRGVDLKHPEYAKTAADDFQVLDLRRWENCLTATRGIRLRSDRCHIAGGSELSAPTPERAPRRRSADNKAKEECRW